MTKPAQPDIEPVPTGRARLSYVWLVPIAALIISLAVAWQSYSGRGPVILVEFDEAAGIQAGETKLKYRELDVGTVETVSFSEDLSKVVAHVRLDKEIAPFVDSASQFWVVKPRVTTRGVSGLQTVLSGVYIEGSWDAEIGNPAQRFTGLDEAPASVFGAEGLRLVLRAKDGNQISTGTPILFKGVDVGRVENPRLAPGGDAVLFDAFIEAPHDQLITTATRFWDASGFSFSFGSGGARIDVESLASLVGGGVSFDTLVSGGRSPTQGRVYALFENEDAVRNDLFSGPAGNEIPYAITFAGTVNGLTSGAPVEFRGIKVGEVTNLSAEFVDDSESLSDIRLRVIVGINPTALGLEKNAREPETTAFLRDAVSTGLRARLTTASLLTGGLKVELIELENAAAATIVTEGSDYPVLPSVTANISDASASAEGVFKRINDLPVEELIASTIGLMNSLNSLANDPALKNTPTEALGLLSDARNVVSSPEIAAIPADVALLMGNLNTTATNLQTLVAELSDAQTIAALKQAITTANLAVADIKNSTTGLPAIASQLESLAARASDLPVDDLIASTTTLVARVDTLAQSDALNAIPPALTAALDEIRQLTAEIRSGDIVANASKTLASTEKAANDVAEAMKTLPDLLARLNRAAAQAQTTLGSFDEDSRMTQDARETLREIRQAADAVTSLARAIERRPNSLLTGR